jgi:hypothetical protein
MPNPKTLPACPKPKIYDGWIRKSDLDAWLDRHLPIPTQVISNEEYQPIPQTEQQCRLEQEIVASAEGKATYLVWIDACFCAAPAAWRWHSPP